MCRTSDSAPTCHVFSVIDAEIRERAIYGWKLDSFAEEWFFMAEKFLNRA